MMKLNPQFLTHETLGEHYIIGTGETGFKGIIKSNETAAFIVERLKTYTSRTRLSTAFLRNMRELTVKPWRTMWRILSASCALSGH